MNKGLKRRLISLLLTLNVLFMAGCAKKVDCNVQGDHMHIYTSEDGLKRYVKGEREYNTENDRTYYRTEEYEVLDDQNEIDLYTFISKKGLIKIEDNLETLKKITSNLKDYYIFEYYTINTSTYTTTESHFDYDIKKTHEKRTKEYSWSTNPDRSNVTGKYSIVTHVYYGYNIVKNGRGKYTLVKSNGVNDFNLLIEMGYKYISTEICTTSHLEPYNKSIGTKMVINHDEVFLKKGNHFVEYYCDGKYSDRLRSDEVISDEVIRTQRIEKEDDDDDRYSTSYGYGYSDSYNNGQAVALIRKI